MSHTESASQADYINRGAKQCGVPAYMVEGLVHYFVHRVAPGGFMLAVLQNDLMRALEKADSTNINCLKAYGMFLYNYAPLGSYGSRENVERWLDHHKSDEDVSHD